MAVKAGAIDTVVAVMRAHVGNAGVSEYACGAMCRICIDIGTERIGLSLYMFIFIHFYVNVCVLFDFS